ncbi:DUF882 domain-containing protein [Escherichia coli]
MTLNNLHTGESIKAGGFFDGRGYIQEELAKLNHFFRDYRAEEANKVHRPGTSTSLSPARVVRHAQTGATWFGYRSIDTNNELRARSGRRKKSYPH